MKYIHSTPGFNILSLILLVMIGFVGCSDEYSVGPRPIGNAVSFTLTVPDVSIPSVSTRTMEGTNNKEDEVKTVDILVFDAAQSPEVLLARVVATNVTQDLSKNPSTVTFSAELPRTSGKARVVMVANQSLSSIIQDSDIGKTKAEIMPKLTHSSTVAWPANGSNSSGYTPIPMYAEKEVSKIYPEMDPIININLVRMLARIDINNEASNFTVENVYLANYNTVGYIASAWDSGTGLLSDPEPDDPMIPGNSDRTGSPYSYSVNGAASYLGEIYTYEAIAAADAASNSDGSPNDGAVSRKDATCLIVKGKMTGDNTSYYYRVDFLKSGTADYMPLKRNYKYTINIKEASGIGYLTMEEAIESYRTMTNLNVRLIAYNRDKISDIVYNGQYMLGVSESAIRVWQYENVSYKIDVFTDSPGGWKAVITDSGGWLNFSNGTAVTGSANTDGAIYLNFPYYWNDVGQTRQATLTITAGRLTHSISIEQYVEEPGMIRFVDAYGNELTNGLFFPMDNTHGDLVAQTVYAMWTSAGVTVSRDRTASGTTAALQYATIVPGIGAPPASGTITEGTPYELFNGVQAITLLPQAGTDAWRQEHLKFRLYDVSNRELGEVTCPINQGNLLFFLEDYPVGSTSSTYKIPLGMTHYLPLKVNVNWKIEKIEVISSSSDSEIVADYGDVYKNQDNTGYLSGGDAAKQDIVGTNQTFLLRFETASWAANKNGTVRITFKNEMHTKTSAGEDVKFPFYRTLDLYVNSETKYYTSETSEAPLFHVNPLRILGSNRTFDYLTLSQAQAICDNMGSGWRLPTLGEMMTSLVYRDALGGLIYDSNRNTNFEGWYHQYNYWTTTQRSMDNKYIVAPFDIPNYMTTDDYNLVRCVYPETSSGTKYPNIQTYGNAGMLITSRDGNLGVNSSVLSTTVVDNKVAPKLLVANENTASGTWNEANSACASKIDNGGGWRLPTLSEAYLIFGLNGSTMDESLVSGTNNGTTSLVWPDSFTKINMAIWTATTNSNNEVYMIGPGVSGNKDHYGFYISPTGKDNVKTNWVVARCVKSVN
ncbi:fimbrial protein [Parabacteroides sp.]|uniref:fimbrial protein n=1 Tax=Parabacteroides sp. TaxID=1869337 RepID=UPI003080F61F